MGVQELDLKIAQLAINVWIGETTVAIRPTDEGREIVAFRKKALSDTILERECLVVSPEYAGNLKKEG